MPLIVKFVVQKKSVTTAIIIIFYLILHAYSVLKVVNYANNQMNVNNAILDLFLVLFNVKDNLIANQDKYVVNVVMVIF